MPFQKFIDPATGQFYNMQKVRDILSKELDPAKETIASCGTGFSPPFLAHNRSDGKYTLSRLRSEWPLLKEECL
jgi:hypothetical protein